MNLFSLPVLLLPESLRLGFLNFIFTETDSLTRFLTPQNCLTEKAVRQGDSVFLLCAPPPTTVELIKKCGSPSETSVIVPAGNYHIFLYHKCILSFIKYLEFYLILSNSFLASIEKFISIFSFIF